MVAQLVVAMVVIGRHGGGSADVREQLRGDPFVLGEDGIDPTQRVRPACRQVAEIADWRGDDIQTGWKRLAHQEAGAWH